MKSDSGTTCGPAVSRREKRKVGGGGFLRGEGGGIRKNVYISNRNGRKTENLKQWKCCPHLCLMYASCMPHLCLIYASCMPHVCPHVCPRPPPRKPLYVGSILASLKRTGHFCQILRISDNSCENPAESGGFLQDTRHLLEHIANQKTLRYSPTDLDSF